VTAASEPLYLPGRPAQDSLLQLLVALLDIFLPLVEVSHVVLHLLGILPDLVLDLQRHQITNECTRMANETELPATSTELDFCGVHHTKPTKPQAPASLSGKGPGGSNSTPLLNSACTARLAVPRTATDRRSMVARLLDAVKKFGARFLAEPNTANAATEKSGSVARQRLQLLIAHQRTGSQLPGVNFQQLQSDLVECIQVRVIAQTPCAAAIVSSPPCPAPFRNVTPPPLPSHRLSATHSAIFSCRTSRVSK